MARPSEEQETQDVSEVSPYAVTVDGGAGVVDVDIVQSMPSGFVERYLVLGTLGQGGMGEVRLVRDRQIGRNVALKTLRSELTGPETRARFVREALVQGQLEHPSVVPVYALDRDPSGREYFTMRRIGGISLGDAIHGAARASSLPWLGEREPIRRRRLLEAFVQVCRAVTYAHDKGVLHRDLKPDNVMLGEHGEVYVLDWGLAKVRMASSEVDSIDVELASGSVPRADTAVGRVLGTPGYMSPEQILNPRAIDERTDTYALGAILFEILAGAPLHQGTDVTALIASTMIDRANRPSERAPDRDIPPELDRACSRALALAPEARYESVLEFSEVVQSYLDGDRDAALRREIASAHGAAAEAAAQAALESPSADTERREAALKEAGRALALDPTNAPAARAIVRLLTAPPREPPPSAQVAISREDDSELRQITRLGGLAVLGFAANLPITFVHPRVSGSALLAIGALLVVASAIFIHTSRASRRSQPWLGLLALTFTFAAIGMSSGLLGPYILVPGFATAAVLASAAVSRFRPVRGVLLALGCAAFLVPFALEVAGLVPPTLRDTPLGVVLDPYFVDIAAEPFRWSGIVPVLATIIIPAIIIWRQQDLLIALRERVHVQNWQLQRLLPEDTLPPPAAAE